MLAGLLFAAEGPRKLTLENASSFWSFKPVQPTPVPAVKNSGWPISTVDRFILVKLEEQQLKPVADADPRVLIRRLHLDLTGLPPTVEEVDAFLADCHRQPCGPTPGLAALRRALGPALAGLGALRRIERQGSQHDLAPRVALPGLGHRRLQP